MQTTSGAKAPGAITRWADNKDPDLNIISKCIRAVVRTFLILVTEYQKNDLSLRAAALTYTILLSLVPILAMSTAIVKGIGGGNDLKKIVYEYIDTLEHTSHTSLTEEARKQVDQSLETSPGETKEPAIAEKAPPVVQDTQVKSKAGSIPAHLRSAADQLFEYVDKTNFATLGTFGVLGLFISILLVFNHIELAMNTIWHVQNGRPLIRKLSDYLTLLILMPISINIGFASSAILKNQHLNSKLDILIPAVWVQALFFKLVPIIFIALTLFIIYLVFPNTKVKSLPAFIGAFLGATLWFSIQNLYISMQIGVSNYNAIYGSFATLPLFLVWIYMGWLFILLGAEIGFSVQNQSTYPLVRHAALPSVKLGAAFDVMERVYKNHKTGELSDTENFCANLSSYTPTLIQETIDQLTEAKLIYLSAEEGGLLPAKPKEQFDKTELVRIILGDESPMTSGGEESRQTLQQLTGSDETGHPQQSEEAR